MTLLLDTHILLWWLEGGGRLSAAQRRALDRISPAAPALLSEISLWEVAVLHELGRIRLSRPLAEWLRMASAPPLVQTCRIDAAVAAETTALPPTFHRDPADRIIVATARVHGASLVTSDGRIAASGAVSCLG